MTTTERRRKMGVCYLCGGKVDEGYKTCKNCIDRSIRYTYQRIAKGICNCGEKIKEGKTKCQKCQDRATNKHFERRKEVFDHYGWKCVCCGETTPEFLTIDHVNNDGNKQRKNNPGQRALYFWLIKNNFPEDFQTLCWNCNAVKRWGRTCPHQVR